MAALASQFRFTMASVLECKDAHQKHQIPQTQTLPVMAENSMPLGATLERSARSAAPRRTTADVASVVPNLFHAFETCARIQLELFVGRGELEHLLELVRADDDVRLARAPSRRDVLDRARRED